MKRNRYFNVPVTSRSIHANDVSLLSMLKLVDEELYQRENERVKITYEDISDKDTIERHNGITSQMYRERNLPERLILVQDNLGLREIETGLIFECEVDSYLGVFELDGMSVIDVFVEEENYSDKASKFFSDYFLNKNKVLSKTGKKFEG